MDFIVFGFCSSSAHNSIWIVFGLTWIRLHTIATVASIVKAGLNSSNKANLHPICVAWYLVQTSTKSKQHDFGNSVLLKMGL